MLTYDDLLKRGFKPIQTTPGEIPAAGGEEPSRDGSLAYGVDVAQKLAGRGVQAVGNVLSLPPVEQFGRDVAAQQDKDIAAGGYQPTYKGGFLEQPGVLPKAGWVGEKVLENAATMAPSLLGFGAAALTAPVSAPLAAAAAGGASAANFLMNTGETAQELDEKGVTNDKAALIGGGIKTGLDVIGGKLVAKPLETVGKQIAGKASGEAGDTVLKAFGKGFLGEGGTEGTQDLVDKATAGSQGIVYPPAEIATGFLENALVGGAMGGAASGIEAAGAKLVKPAEPAAAGEPPADGKGTVSAKPSSPSVEKIVNRLAAARAEFEAAAAAQGEPPADGGGGGGRGASPKPSYPSVEKIVNRLSTARAEFEAAAAAAQGKPPADGGDGGGAGGEVGAPAAPIPAAPTFEDYLPLARKDAPTEGQPKETPSPERQAWLDAFRAADAAVKPASQPTTPVVGPLTAAVAGAEAATGIAAPKLAAAFQQAAAQQEKAAEKPKKPDAPTQPAAPAQPAAAAPKQAQAAAPAGASPAPAPAPQAPKEAAPAKSGKAPAAPTLSQPQKPAKAAPVETAPATTPAPALAPAPSPAKQETRDGQVQGRKAQAEVTGKAGAETQAAPAPAAPAGPRVASFRTEKGSTYQVHDDGTTTRNKAARSDVGHENDSGPKTRSARTVYTDRNPAMLSAAGLQNLGSKGARVVLRNGKATLITWNDKAGKWGAAPSARDIPVFDEPRVGAFPLELWDKRGDVGGAQDAYAGMHAGNRIVEVGNAEAAPAPDTTKAAPAPMPAPQLTPIETPAVKVDVRSGAPETAPAPSQPVSPDSLVRVRLEDGQHVFVLRQAEGEEKRKSGPRRIYNADGTPTNLSITTRQIDDTGERSRRRYGGMALYGQNGKGFASADEVRAEVDRLMLGQENYEPRRMHSASGDVRWFGMTKRDAEKTPDHFDAMEAMRKRHSGKPVQSTAARRAKAQAEAEQQQNGAERADAGGSAAPAAPQLAPDTTEAKTKAPGEAQPKETWAMTRDEFVQAVRGGRDFKQIGTSPTPLKTLRGAGAFDILDRQAKDHHQATVTMAFLENKGVPPEVLADYPELAGIAKRRSAEEQQQADAKQAAPTPAPAAPQLAPAAPAAPAAAAPPSETIKAGEARGLRIYPIDEMIAAYKGDRMLASMAADLEKKKAEGATLVVMRGPTAYPARDKAHAEMIIKGILAARDEKNASAKKADARLVGYVVGSLARQEGAPANIIASVINIAKNGTLRGLKRGGRMPDGEMAGGDDLKILYAAGIKTAKQLEDAIVAERARMAAAEARRQAVPPGETAATPATAPTTETGSTGQRRAGLAVGGAEDLDASIDEIRARTSPPTTPAPAAPPERVSTNTIITDAMFEAARARMKAKLGQLNAGIDPEMLADGAVMAAYYIERGFRSFAAYSAQMIESMGESIRPYLRAFYEGARHFPGFDAEGMTSYADLEQMKDAEPAPAEAGAPAETENAAHTGNDEAPREDTQDDSATQRREDEVDQGLDEGPQPNDATRGTQQPRDGDGFEDDRGIRDGGEQGNGRDDAQGNVGDRGRNERVRGGKNGAVGNRRERVSGTDYRPGVGGLTREGSWFEAAKRNLDIIDLARQIESEKRPATPEEQALLSKYVGFGAGEIRNNLFPVPSIWQKQQARPGTLIFPEATTEARWKALAERAAALPEAWQRTMLQSTQYAHYTSENVIRSIWSAVQRLGFTGGKIFEPGAGIGSFSMLMPESVHETSTYTGIEFDGPTALIARLLSPEQRVLHADFIKRVMPDDFFDVAVGNPPFLDVKITADPRYQKQGFLLHDYFFAKTIDKVRPGGLLAFVTSKGTMDKKTDKARRYLMARADFLGAIRLPSTAFEANAGTSVVTDVIFLRKRVAGEAPAGLPWGSVETVETPDGPVVINEYFASHPEMVLGQNRISGNIDDEGRRINSNGIGGEKYTVVSYDKTPEELDAKFAAAVEKLPSNVYSVMGQTAATIQSETTKVDFDPKSKKEGTIYVNKNGDLMRVNGGVGRPLEDTVKLSDKDKAWFKGYVGLRELVQETRYAQLTDGNWEKPLKALNKAYDAFVKEHGHINAFRTQVRKTTDSEGNEVEKETRVYINRRLLREDYEAAAVMQLEYIDEDGNINKGKFMHERTIGKPVTRNVQTVGDALAVSLDNVGKLNLDDIAIRMKLPREEIIDALGDQIYRVPGGDWQLADEYLSGDVVEKLRAAEEAAATDPALERNVKALEAVQPEKLGPSQISVKLGAPWVSAEHMNAFAAEIGAGRVKFDHKTETWSVEGSEIRSARNAADEYGTSERSPSELLQAVLNSRTIKVMKTIKNGDSTKTVIDVDATTSANEMAKKIKEKFKSWVWTDTDRAADLVEAYNERYNTLAGRVFDGSHLTLPGVSLRWQKLIHKHQLRTIWRQIQTGNTYLAHAVGAGKTIEMIVGGMEQKRLGLIKKPMYVVPNHMLEQFSNEFMDLYPLANIMVADDSNFSKERRKAFVAASSMNAPDAIIITHSAFEMIGVKEESVAPIRDEILADLEAELSDAAKNKGDRVRRSQLQRQIEAVTQRFDSIVGASGKDSLISFEEMGVDFVYVDEAHAYRKLDFHTEQKIKGIDPNGSRRAMDMYVKTRWLESQRPGRSMVFASGTPVTNTMGELFTIMRFFAQKALDEGGISTFDSWSRMFGESASALEPNASGKYEVVERFSRFVNVPELMSQVRQFMDVLQSDQLGAIVKRPDMRNDKPHMIVVKPTKALINYQENVLTPRLEASRAWKPTKDEPNNPDPVIAIITDGRFAAMDPRFFGGKILPGETTKIDAAADEIIKVHAAIADNEYVDRDGKPMPIKGGTQIVFYNTGFGASASANRRFDARAWLTKRLVEGGINKNQIAWFDDADTNAKKEEIFKGMRNGTYRVLIGSAKKMGTGVNVQNRLAAMHYIDPPWFPSDLEQPRGRMIRQGNQNEIVDEFWYSTEGGYDSTMWQMVGRKKRFIDQAFSGDKNLRTMDDMGEAAMYEQAAALASGDPRAIQLAGLKQDVERLERQQSAHATEQLNARSELRHQLNMVEYYEKAVEKLQAALDALGDRYFRFEQGKVGNEIYTKQTDFGQAIKNEYNKHLLGDVGKKGKTALLGTLSDGVKIYMGPASAFQAKDGAMDLYVKVGDYPTVIVPNNNTGLGADVDDLGLVRQIINAINGIDRLKEQSEKLRNEAATNVIRLKKKVGAPFEFMQEMLEKHAALKELEEELRQEGLQASAQAAPEDAAPEAAAPEGAASDELALEAGDQTGEVKEPERPYETDLFGNPLPAKRGRAAGRAAPADQRNMDASAAVPPAAEHAPDNPDAGTYGTVAELVETRRQRLGHAGPVRTLEDSANALAYLHRSAVERVDALVTDADGKPLAIVGGFKGDIASSTVPKLTLVTEIMQVPGAKTVWLSHNHPSDDETLSDADRNLAQQIRQALKGTGVDLGGLTSVTQSRWSGYNPEWYDETHRGEISPTDGPFIPAQERQLSARGKIGEKIESPAGAKEQGRRLMENHGGRPGIMMLDSQNRPIAYVPWNPLRAAQLKDNGGLAALYRAVSRANPRSAIIMTDEVMHPEAAKNLATGLAQIGVKVLDIITPAGSFVEAAREVTNGNLYSRVTSTPASATPAGRGLPLTQARRVADAFAQRLGLAPERIVVLGSAREIGAPDGYITKGAYDPQTGTVYLFADALDGAEDARRVLLHEVVGHLGVRAAVGDGWATVRRLLEQGRAGDRGIADLFEQVAREESAALDADAVADEVIGRAAERYGTAGPLHWRRVLGAIRAALRRLGLVKGGYSLNEVVDLLAAGRQAVRADAAIGGPAMAYARQTKAQGRIRRTIDELVAAAQSQANWRDWYSRHEKVLNDLFGNDAELFQRMLSATSQANTVKGNVTLALKAYAQFLDGQPFSGYIPAVARNLDRIRADEALQGPKISQYGKANEGDESAIAVDRHISMLLFNTVKPNGAQIRAAKARIRAVADRLGWSPREIQAALWAFNQTRLGTNPDEVQSYDRLLEARADFIRELRAEYGRGEGGSLSTRRGDGEGTEAGAATEGSGDALRFSRARDVTDTIRNYINDTFRGAGPFNALNRTIGTHYHKAWKSPEYARVYNGVQDFLRDAQSLAYRASEKAPTLLPKLDGVRDVFQHIAPRNAQGNFIRERDIKAAADAVFDGRVQDRVWSDDELRERGMTPAQIGLYREARASLEASLDDVAAGTLSRLAALDDAPRVALMQAQADPANAFEILAPHVNNPEPLRRAAIDKALKKPKQGLKLLSPYLLKMPVADAAKVVSTALKAGNANAAYESLSDYFQPSTLERMRDEQARILRLKENGYAPLSRFGDYFVRATAVDENGNEQVLLRLHFESSREMFAAARALREDPEFSSDNIVITTGTVARDDSLMFTGLTPETLELFGDAIGLDTSRLSNAYQEYLKVAVASQSALKRLIRARKIPGYSRDLPRVLASFIVSNSRHASRAYHDRGMRSAWAAIPDRLGDVRDEAGRLIDYVQNPREEAAGVRSLLFAQFIGGSIASAAMNMTQPLTMTLPYLSSLPGVGPVKAAALMGRALKAILRGGDADLMAAMKRAEADGTVAPQEIHQLYAEAIRTGLTANRRLGRWVRAAATVWGSMFSIAEQFNRRITFAAAYMAAKENGSRAPFAAAEKAVNETQGVYNKGNRPNWARGAVGATLFTFKQFSIAYMEFLSRLPPRERAMALGLLALAAGAQGLPGADDLDDLVDTLAQALGYNWRTEDQKRAFAQRVIAAGLKQFMAEGEAIKKARSAADFLMYGLSTTGLPIDFQQRMGLGNLIPGTELLKRSSPDKTRDVMELAGPAGGLAQQWMRAWEAFASTGLTEGAILRGGWEAAKQLAPTAVASAMKARDMAETGFALDARGRRIAPVTTADTIARAVGFQPASIAAGYRKTEGEREAIAFAKVEEAAITDMWADGRFQGDDALIRRARARLDAWNSRNPDAPISVQASQIMKRVREMAKTRDQRLSATAPKEMRQALKGVSQ